MPAEITFVGTGLPFRELDDITIQEDATPIEPSSSFGGVGQITTRLRAFDDAELLTGTISVSDGVRGKTSGIIRTLSIADGGLSITADSSLALFNKDMSVPPFTGTFSSAIQFYVDLVGIANTVTVDASLAGRSVAYPGWYGNVWVKIKEILVKEQAEMVLIYDHIYVRELRSNISKIDRSTSLTRTIDSSTAARAIDISYFNNTYGTQIEVYPLSYDDDDKAQIYQVDAGETLVVTERLNASMMSVNQPVISDFVYDSSYAGTNGVYSVVGNDSLPIPSSQWTAFGGSLSVALTDDPSIIEITIVGANMKDYAPYRIAMSSGSGNDYNSLHITGTGVAFNKETIRIPTGAVNVPTVEEVGISIENPFINTLGEAYSLGAKAAQAYAGLNHTISGSGRNLNRDSGSGNLVMYTIGDFNDEVAAGTDVSEFNIVWASTTIAAFNAVQQAKMDDLFENQLYGNIVGSRILDTDANFRVNSVTATPAEVQYSASADTLLDDFNDRWPNEDTLRTNLVLNPRHVPTTTYSVFSTNYSINPEFAVNVTGWSMPVAYGTLVWNDGAARLTATAQSGASFYWTATQPLGTSGWWHSTFHVRNVGSVAIRLGAALYFYGGPGTVNTNGPTVDLDPGDEADLTVIAPSPTAGQDSVRAVLRQTPIAGAGAVVDVEWNVTTPSATVEPFFSGSTTDTADDVYAWTGTPNASTSTRSVRKASAGWAYPSTGLVALTVDGERAMRALTNLGAGLRYLAYELANRQYTFGTPVSSVWRVTNDSPTTAFTLRSSLVTYMQAGTTLYSTHGDLTTVLPGQTLDISVEGKVLDGINVWGYRAFLYATNAWVAGDQIRIHRVSVMDGTFSSDVARTNLCTNPSVEAGLTGWVSSAVTIEQDTAWAASGFASCKLTPTGSTYDCHVTPAPIVSTWMQGLAAGETYTVAATIRLSATQVGTLSTRARRISAFVRQADGVTYVETQGTQAPNAAGTFRSAVTFSIPADATGAFVRLYNGSNSVTDVVWWDAVTVEGGVTDGSYFDGSYFGCNWAGVENASESFQRALFPAVLDPYFDGGTPDADGTFYDWTAAENVSTSTETYLSQSIARFNTEYAGYTCRDFSIKPLRRI